jgi:cyanuric acid amidohydrolase
MAGLRELLDTGAIQAEQVVALQGKTEGDAFGRRLATDTTTRLLASYLQLTPDEVGERIPMVWSAGADGVISPHVVVFTRDDSRVGDGVTPRLASARPSPNRSCPRRSAGSDRSTRWRGPSGRRWPMPDWRTRATCTSSRPKTHH